MVEGLLVEVLLGRRVGRDRVEAAGGQGTEEHAAFGPTDRIGQLTMRNLDIADSRAMLELYAVQPIDQGQVLVENGVLLGALPTGGFDTITANPGSEADLDEEALDHAAMEFGTD